MVARLCVERRRMDAVARGAQRAECTGFRIRIAPGIVAARRRRPFSELPRNRAATRRVHDVARLYARGVDADHRASVLRLVGVLNHPPLSPHPAPWDAPGPPLFSP